MSRRTILWRKKIGRSWSVKMKGGSKTLTSGNGGSIEHIIPTTHVRGEGKYLKGVSDRAGVGVGNTVTLPMTPEKEARVRRLVPK